MPYEELSSLPGGSTGNANEKQGPKALPASAFGKTSAPTSEVIQERPNYIFVNILVVMLFLLIHLLLSAVLILTNLLILQVQ